MFTVPPIPELAEFAQLRLEVGIAVQRVRSIPNPCLSCAIPFQIMLRVYVLQCSLPNIPPSNHRRPAYTNAAPSHECSYGCSRYYKLPFNGVLIIFVLIFCSAMSPLSLSKSSTSTFIMSVILLISTQHFFFFAQPARLSLLLQK